MHRRRLFTSMLTAVAVLLGSLVLATGTPASAAEDCPALNEAPALYAPEGTVEGHRPWFSWSAVEGIDEYVVAIFYEGNDEQYVTRPYTANGTSFRPPDPLPFYTAMRWQVKTECGEQYGPFSESMYFDLEPRCRNDNC